jgi:hypothetical protein
VFLDRGKEEQEIRDEIGSGIIGVEGFRKTIEKMAIETRRPKIGRHKKWSVQENVWEFFRSIEKLY